MEKPNWNAWDRVIDYLIPGISGLNVIKEVEKSGMNFTIIILTACGDEDLGKEMIKEGIAD